MTIATVAALTRPRSVKASVLQIITAVNNSTSDTGCVPSLGGLNRGD